MNNSPSDRPAWHKDKLFLILCTVAIVGASVIGFFAYTGHGPHMLKAVPYLLLLSCPLMHFFMHGKMHGSHRHDDAEPTAKTEDKTKRGGGCH